MLPGLYERVPDHADGDLTFFTHVHQDAVRLEWMLGHLRRHYPAVRVIVCSDGDGDPKLPRIAERTRAEFHLGERLYGIEAGGRIMHRLLELFFEQPTPFLFKVDPDTGFHRRLAWLPRHSGVFGTLQANPLLCSIQGGCCGFSREAAEKMFRSEAFLCPSLQNPETTWASHEPLLNYMQRVGRVSTDWLTGYVATVLNIPQFGFSEVHSTWAGHVPNPALRYAITHPCKQMRL